MKTGKRAGTGSRATSFIAGGVAVVVVLGAVAAWWIFLRSTPERTVRDYLAACKAGNEQAAKACLSAASVKELDSLGKAMPAELSALMGSVKLATSLVIPPMFDLEAEVGKAEVKGGSATVPVKLKPKDPNNKMMQMLTARPRTVKCVREGGKWKLDFAAELKRANQFIGAFAGRMGNMGEIAKTMGQQYAGAMSAAGGPGAAPSAASAPSVAPPTTAGTPAATATAPSAEAAGLISAGMSDKQQADYTAAAAKFKQALALEPNNADAHWGLAWVLADQNKKPQAIQHFQKVIQLSPDATRRSQAQEAITRLQ